MWSCKSVHAFLSSAECVADLALVVDSSGSITDPNVGGHEDNYDLVRKVSQTLHFLQA